MANFVWRLNFFLAQAQAEQQLSRTKPTDSALSLLSGLHRKDVRELLATGTLNAGPRTSLGKASPANQVVTRWLAAWPKRCP